MRGKEGRGSDCNGVIADFSVLYRWKFSVLRITKVEVKFGSPYSTVFESAFLILLRGVETLCTIFNEVYNPNAHYH